MVTQESTKVQDLNVEELLELIDEALEPQGAAQAVYIGGIHFNADIVRTACRELENRILFRTPMSALECIATELMLPVKMLEYIALDIPVIAPKLKTIEYYFDNEMVSYFEAESVESLSNAIKKLYYDENIRIKQTQKARKFLDKYGWEKHQKDLFALYAELN